MSVALRTEILPTPLTAKRFLLCKPHGYHKLHANDHIITRRPQKQTTQYVLTFDRYLHPDKEKNLFIA